MTENSPTWVDIRVKVDGRLLVHLETACWREGVNGMLFIPAVSVVVFQGYRVVAIVWEVGGRIYAHSQKGVVVALDDLCHFEIRLAALSSRDAAGSEVR